jgi:uncharacterized protein (TIGR03382 family)
VNEVIPQTSTSSGTSILQGGTLGAIVGGGAAVLAFALLIAVAVVRRRRRQKHPIDIALVARSRAGPNAPSGVALVNEGATPLEAARSAIETGSEVNMANLSELQLLHLYGARGTAETGATGTTTMTQLDAIQHGYFVADPDTNDYSYTATSIGPGEDEGNDAYEVGDGSTGGAVTGGTRGTR